MTTGIPAERPLAAALAAAGRCPESRAALFEVLRRAELASEHPADFRRDVRWPLVQALLPDEVAHRVELAGGLLIEVRPDSRIEKALLLSTAARPDHVWEPYTTRLLAGLAAGACDAIVGGAYIGDQVLFLARALARRTPPGVIHAFEPMAGSFRQLQRNLALNGAGNVRAHRLGLWDVAATRRLSGLPALASMLPGAEEEPGASEVVEVLTIDDYVAAQALERVGLVMLDLEGGEEKALRGAAGLLGRPGSEAPHLVFEVHRHYVDWSDGLRQAPVIRFLLERGYDLFAVRDYHDNREIGAAPVEVIPLDAVYLEGPPHGFNMLATKDAGLIDRLGLCVVEDVSPKLLDRGGRHQPLRAPAREAA